MVSDPNDELLRLGFRSASAAWFLADGSGTFRDANEQFLALFGWDAAPVQPLSSIVRPEDRVWMDSTVARLASGEQDELRTALRLVHSDGSTFDGLISVTPARTGDRCVGFVGQVRRNERRDVVDDVRVAKLLEHNASTLTLIDERANVLETAGRYRHTLGYPVEFWETRNLFDILIPEDLDRALELREELMSAPGRVLTSDFAVTDAEGARHVLEVTAVNLLHDHDVRGIVLTSRNVSEERATRQNLALLRDEAVAEAERRSALLATVSHELRNPLHALSGLSELLASDDQLPSASRELAATLHRQATQLARVTDDLLETARLEIGEMRLHPSPTRLHDVVDDLVELARAATADSTVEVRISFDPLVPAVVTTDGSRVHQLLWNLLSNAVRFTDHGFVDIRVAPAAAIADVFPLVIEVRDTGPGIPPDELQRVFEPFRTASRDDDRSGAGLGLAIVRRIVELLGGTIDLESELGTGTTFRVVIPVEHHDVAFVQATESAVDPVDSGEPIVLVIEDNQVNQQLAYHQLGRLGMRPIMASTAEEALRLVAGQEVDVILMDHQLPGMNGREATRELRRRGVEAPIIGVTASATAADERECLEAGMDAFLAKPVGMAQLRTVLESVLMPEPAGPPQEGGDPTVDHRGSGAGAHLSVLDVTVLATLDDELGDPAIVDTLIETFLSELAVRRADIAGADRDLAIRQAHTLKSSARLLGAHALADACQQVEDDPSAAVAIDAHAAAAASALAAWLRTSPERSAP